MLRCEDFDTLKDEAEEYINMLALVLSGPSLSDAQKTKARMQCFAMVRMITEVLEHIEEKA